MDRTKYIGGSDIAAILGVSPYKTALEVYLEKRGELAPVAIDDKPAVYFGKVLENTVAHEYRRRTGNRIRRVNVEVVHPEHEFMVGHIDRDVVKSDRIIECKTSDSRLAHLWGEAGSDQIPDYYLTQCHWYLGLLPAKQAVDVPVLIGGNDFRIYTVLRDDRLIEVLQNQAKAFWRMVQDGVPPPLDTAHRTAPALLKRMFPGTSGETLIADIELEHWSTVLQQAKERAATYEGVIEGAKAHLLHALGNGSELVMPDGSKYTRKQVSRKGYTVPDTSYIDFRYSKAKNKGE